MNTYPIRITGLIAATALGPYVATETEMGRNAVSQVSSVFSGDATVEPSAALPPATGDDYAHHALYEVEQLRRLDPERYRYDENLARKLGAIPADPNAMPTLSGYHVGDLGEVLRFDITADWVIQRFSRVSTVLANLELEGMRVPIVTGIRADDLAGTLTYYFDKSGRLQRLTIHGFTGDPSRFAGLMVAHYGLQREPSLDAGVFTKRWNGRPTHFMRLTRAPVVYSDAVHQKYTVFLELNEPNLAYGISDEARQIVASDNHTGRW
ncbi:hypothetical protein FYK55_04465 [Roseiconus nitratireducens]|uniref:DUF6690 domain-containing protein n=1 Tax=Roseiconus nitratireducens TaxID=2605748 RepID=A0A5M6DLC5_9BACT|nr:DUF6690 family protein [Roseiconus nitratireducens]KAA5546155.1 hypothetical protein FYK55_04465 [Roseiconus nitratireducens]